MADKKDAIWREDAITLTTHYRFGMDKFAFECIVERLTTMPSADVVEREKYEDLKECYDVSHHYEMEYKEQLERKRGEWIKHDEERDYCSLCKCIFKTRTLTKQDKWTTYVDDLCFHFCPNCGADMRGAE